MCGGMQGCPLLAVLFIFSIFVEGNKSRVGGMWGQGWAGRAGQQSVGRGSAGDGGQPALPNHPICPCDTQPGPSSVTSLMDREGGCGSPS